MKKNRKLVLGGIAVVVLAVVMLCVYRFTRPETTEGTKTFTVEVVHQDKTAKTFTYKTDKEYVGEALLEEGLIAGEVGEYGLYVTEVDGEKAIYEENNSYWAFYEGGEYASTGVDQTPVEDGDAFSLVYTIG